MNIDCSLYPLNSDGSGDLVFPTNFRTQTGTNCSKLCNEIYSTCIPGTTEGKDQCEEVCSRPASDYSNDEKMNCAACWSQIHKKEGGDGCDNACKDSNNPYRVQGDNNYNYCVRECESGVPCDSCTEIKPPSPPSDSCQCTNTCKMSNNMSDCYECCGKCDVDKCKSGSGCKLNDDSGECVPSFNTPGGGGAGGGGNGGGGGDEFPSGWTKDFYNSMVKDEMKNLNGITENQAKCIVNGLAKKYQYPPDLKKLDKDTLKPIMINCKTNSKSYPYPEQLKSTTNKSPSSSSEHTILIILIIITCILVIGGGILLLRKKSK